MEFAGVRGIAAVSIGEVAKLANMSRTGIISHFKDKEDMQIAILKFSEQEFTEVVIDKSYDPIPIKNLQNLIKLWRNWTRRLEFDSETGCPFIKAKTEYQNQPDTLLKAFVLDQQVRFIGFIEKILKDCVGQGSIDKQTPTSILAYQIYATHAGYAITNNVSLENSDEIFFDAVELLIHRYQPHIKPGYRFIVSRLSEEKTN